MAKLSYGSFYVSSSALTALSAATPAKAAGTTTAGELPADGQFTHTSNRLTYAGTVTRDFGVTAWAAITKASGTQSKITVHIYKQYLK